MDLFLDDDDVWFDQKLQKINNFAKLNKNAFLFHDVNINKNGKWSQINLKVVTILRSIKI